MNSNIEATNPARIRKSKLSIYMMLTSAAIMYAVCIKFFVIDAQIYTPGFNGIATGISYVFTDVLKIPDGSENFMKIQMGTYWIFYIIFNIPVLFLMWRWYGKMFFIRTMYVFTLNFAISMFLTFTPGFDNAHVLPLGSDKTLPSYIVGVIMLGAIGGVLFGVSVGTALKNGGSTGGFDPISKYLSREKGYKISRVLLVIGILTSFTFIFIRFFTDHSVAITWHNFIERVLISPELVSTLVFLGAYSIVTSLIYTATKKLQVQITSQKWKDISDFLIETNYHRGHTIMLAEGGYSRKESNIVSLVINIEELPDITEDIIKIDPKAFISVVEIDSVYDNHDWTPKTKYDKDLKAKRKTTKNNKK